MTDVEASARELPTEPLGRPIRVVLFCGPILERGMVRFARLLEDHPGVEFVGGICQTEGLGTRAWVRNLVKRRGLLALPILAMAAGASALEGLRGPRTALNRRRSLRWLEGRLHPTRNMHGPDILDRIRRWEPDLAVVYGGPILQPELFNLPRFGTLGIHHGRLPEFRGKKTTLRAILAGEHEAGVTIQHIRAGIDAGLVVREGAVPAQGRAYGRVEGDLEELGLDLYLDAVLAVGRGEARGRPLAGPLGPLHRDPTPGELLGYARKRVRDRIRGLPPRSPEAPPGVLLLTESYHPMVGGGETQARGLAGALRETGLPVTVVTRRWDPERSAVGHVDGIPVYRVPPSGPGHLKKWGLVRSAREPIRIHRRTHPVLLVSGFRVLGIPAVRAARRYGLRVILKADSTGELSGDFFGPGLARLGMSRGFPPVRAALALRNRLLRRADAFVAISSAVEAEYRAHGVPEGRIHRIPNGVDTERFRPPGSGERTRLRRELGLPDEGTLVMYTGRLVSYKGLPLLLEAWKDLAPRHPEPHLVLVGEGGADIHNCEAELRARAGPEGGVPRVHFTGAVENVADHLRAADIFVFPSEDEAFGLSVVEAMASGLPVVSTRAGGLADFVGEDTGCLPIPPGDGAALTTALDHLLSDLGRARQLGEAGRRTAVERFSFREVRDAYLALFDPSPSPSHP